MILIPGGKVESRKPTISIDKFDKYEVSNKGKDIAILALGDFYPMGEELSKERRDSYLYVCQM